MSHRYTLLLVHVPFHLRYGGTSHFLMYLFIFVMKEPICANQNVATPFIVLAPATCHVTLKPKSVHFYERRAIFFALYSSLANLLQTFQAPRDCTLYSFCKAILHDTYVSL